MERNHHTRIPVHLNAVLIGKHTVPKGCRVRNVSQQGMMLNCEADGRVLTFKHDDSVDIHLLFQDNNGCRYLTKTAHVRHVNENSIGVEFLHPDTELVELLRACNVVDSHMPAEPAANDQEIHESASPGETGGPDNFSIAATMHTDRINVQPTGRANKPVYTVIAVLFGAACILAGAVIYTSGISARLDRLETMVNTHSNELEIIKVAPVSTDTLDTSIADLNKRIIILTDSFAALEQRLTPPPEKHPGDSAGIVPEPDTGTITTTVSTTPKPVETKPAKITASGPTAAPTRHNAGAMVPTGSGRSGGPWVINLISSRDQAATDQFLEKALSQGIPVERRKAEIKGKVYWRLQVSGFSSADEAKSYSGDIKEKLGLRDIWIFRQQN